MKKQNLLIVMLGFFMLSLMFAPNTVTPASAGAGTAGSFDDMRAEVQENSWVSIVVTDLTSNAEFIVTATTGSNIDNITFATGSGQTSASFTRQAARPSGGVLTLTLYGYSTTTGANSGTALDSVLVSIGASENFNVNILTDYIGLFVVGGILVGIVVMFRERVL